MPVALKTYDRLRDAVAALGSETGSRYLGGGTLLVRNLIEGSVQASSMIRSTERSMTEIRPAGGRITVGAGVTMAQIAAHPDLKFLAPVARTIGGPAIRNMATVGGNLFAPYPYGDFAVAMLALEATVSVQSGYSPRDTALDEFLLSADRGNRAVVAAITFRRPESDRAFRYVKMSRTHPKGASVVSIAAHLPASGGRLSSPRVAYGAMAPTAIRAKAVEAALNGKTLDEAGIAQALAVATEGCHPQTDPFASDWYRREVLPVYLKRLLLS
ncbi:FAD binding domain-containing protein [Microbaculum marinum]|uniref:FAD binding domain-containing protein n=1 Tax=Microbaculum marinum TaxID=1764581 RepID=A0AAW9RCZ4_9HYPH